MGAAKNRGTREERVAAAIVRDTENARLHAIYRARVEASDAYKERQRRNVQNVALIGAMAGAFNPHLLRILD